MPARRPSVAHLSLNVITADQWLWGESRYPDGESLRRGRGIGELRASFVLQLREFGVGELTDSLDRNLQMRPRQFNCCGDIATLEGVEYVAMLGHDPIESAPNRHRTTPISDHRIGYIAMRRL